MYGEGVLHEQFSGIGSRETKNRSVESCEAGRCHHQGNKGPELVMLPNSRLVNLELHKDWSLKLERLRYILQSESRPDVAGWGDRAWLSVFYDEDHNCFCEELSDELVIDASKEDYSGLEELLSDWKATAGQLEDPLRRKILLSPGLDRDDFAEARDPKAMEEIE